MALVLFYFLVYGKNLTIWFLAPIGVVIGGITYFGMLIALHVPEIKFLQLNITNRLKRKAG